MMMRRMLMRGMRWVIWGKRRMGRKWSRLRWGGLLVLVIWLRKVRFSHDFRIGFVRRVLLRPGD